MLQKMVLMVLAAVLFSGCSTMAKKEVVMPIAPQKSEQEQAMERFDLRVAKAFAALGCPNPGSFEKLELFSAQEYIFEKKAEQDWLRGISKLVQEMSDGNVYVTKGKDHDFGLYEGRRLYLKVFSLRLKREYVIFEFEKTIFFDCDDLSLRQEIFDGLLGS